MAWPMITDCDREPGNHVLRGLSNDDYGDRCSFIVKRNIIFGVLFLYEKLRKLSLKQLEAG